MSQNSKIFIAVVVTAVVVGSGMYYWQQNQIQPNLTPSSQPSSAPVAKTKTIDDYVSLYEKSPITLSKNQSSQLVKVFSLGLEKCSSDPALSSEFCTPEMIKNGAYISGISLLSDTRWNDGKDHEFYFEFGSEGPAAYYGPFMDNVLRLQQEASKKDNYNK